MRSIGVGEGPKVPRPQSLTYPTTLALRGPRPAASRRSQALTLSR
jgi:hypothetical protein